MRKITAIKLLFALLFVSGGMLEAATDITQCCRPVYECGCNPLYCGAYSFQLHGGIVPLKWRKRGEVDLLSCTANPTNPVFQLAAHFPKFRSLYKLPWTFGGIVGYAWSDNVELYIEFNYLQASRKHDVGFAFDFPNVSDQSLVIRLAKYNLIDGYVGIRYYFDRFCNWVSPFVGIKTGFTMHRTVNADLSVNGLPVELIPAAGVDVCVPNASRANNHFFSSSTVIAGGVNGGLDICFCGGWSFTITGEFVVSCGPRVRTASVFVTQLQPPTLATNLILGGLGSELRFPITFGIKKSF